MVTVDVLRFNSFCEHVRIKVRRTREDKVSYRFRGRFSDSLMVAVADRFQVIIGSFVLDGVPHRVSDALPRSFFRHWARVVRSLEAADALAKYQQHVHSFILIESCLESRVRKGGGQLSLPDRRFKYGLILPLLTARGAGIGYISSPELGPK